MHGIALSWVVFLLLLRWRTGVQARQIALEQLDVERCLHVDELDCQTESARFQSEQWETTRHSVRQELARQGGRGAGGDIFTMLLIGSATLGLWILWLLIRDGANLRAQLMLDAVLLPAHPKLALKVPTQSWLRTAVELTLPHFFSLTFLAGIFTAILSMMLSNR